MEKVASRDRPRTISSAMRSIRFFCPIFLVLVFSGNLSAENFHQKLVESDFLIIATYNKNGEVREMTIVPKGKKVPEFFTKFLSKRRPEGLRHDLHQRIVYLCKEDQISSCGYWVRKNEVRGVKIETLKNLVGEKK